MESHFGFSTENFGRPLDAVRVTDFLGHVTEVRQLVGSYPYAGDGGDGGGGGGGGGGAQSSGIGGGGSDAGGGDRPAAGGAPAAAGVKGRLSGRAAQDGSGGGGAAEEWGTPTDALTLGGIVGLIALMTGASLAWGGAADAV
jgi:hypothetical protein